MSVLLIYIIMFEKNKNNIVKYNFEIVDKHYRKSVKKNEYRHEFYECLIIKPIGKNVSLKLNNNGIIVFSMEKFKCGLDGFSFESMSRKIEDLYLSYVFLMEKKKYLKEKELWED